MAEIPPFIQRLKGHQQIKFEKDGALIIGGIKGILFPISTLIFWDIIKKKYGKKYSEDVINYTVGKIQGIFAGKYPVKKFGIKMKKKDLIQLVISQSHLTGIGNLQILKYNNEKKEILIKNTNSIYAKQYRTLLGLQSRPVDFFLAGNLAGVMESILDVKMECSEKCCVAMGKEICIFEVKKRNSLKGEIILNKELEKEVKNFKKFSGFFK